jgi:hypothetical protein
MAPRGALARWCSNRIHSQEVGGASDSSEISLVKLEVSVMAKPRAGSTTYHAVHIEQKRMPPSC